MYHALMFNIKINRKSCLVLAGLTIPALCFGADKYGTVVYVEGLVRFRRKLDTKELFMGEVLLEGDVIITGAGGRVEVELGANNVLTIDENTRVQLKKESSLESEWEMEQGSMRASLSNWNSKAFTVRTPSAVAGVRGTDFVTEYHPDDQEQAFQLMVLEGMVNVDGINPTTKAVIENVLLNASEGVHFNFRGELKQRLKINAEMLQRVRERFKTRREKIGPDKLPDPTKDKLKEKMQEKLDERREKLPPRPDDIKKPPIPLRPPRK